MTTGNQELVALIWLALLFLPPYIAWRKGRSFFGFLVFSILLWIVALPVAIFIKRDEPELERRRFRKGIHRCPHCREFVRVEATVCPHCARDITPEDLARRAAPKVPVSFNEPMSFPKGSTLYVAAGKRLAVLPDASLVLDDGQAGIAYESAIDYRYRTGDNSLWTIIREW
jgi:hypothetical protein